MFKNYFNQTASPPNFQQQNHQQTEWNHETPTQNANEPTSTPMSNEMSVTRGKRRTKRRAKSFIPFNFSSMGPFDSISSFLNVAPIPHHTEPKTNATEMEQVLLNYLPTENVHREMVDAINGVVSNNDGEWPQILQNTESDAELFADGGDIGPDSILPRRFLSDLRSHVRTFRQEPVNNISMQNADTRHIGSHSSHNQVKAQFHYQTQHRPQQQVQNQPHYQSHHQSQQSHLQHRQRQFQNTFQNHNPMLSQPLPENNQSLSNNNETVASPRTEQKQFPQSAPHQVGERTTPQIQASLNSIRSPKTRSRRELLAQDEALFRNVSKPPKTVSPTVKQHTQTAQRPQTISQGPRHTKVRNEKATDIPIAHVQNNEGDTEEKEYEKEVQLEKISKQVDDEEVLHFERYLQDFNLKVEKMRDDLQSSFWGQMRVTGHISAMKNLYEKVTIHASRGHIESVNPDVLRELLTILQTRITGGYQHCKQMKSNTISKVSAEQALLAMIAACTSIAIISARGLPRSLIIEEHLERIIELFRTILTGIVFPISDPLYQIPPKAAKQRTSETSDSTVGDGEFDRTYNPPPLNAAESSRQPARTKRDNDALLDFSSRFCDALTSLFEREKNLPNSITSRCATVCVQSMSINGIDRLQSHAIRTVCAIFKAYTSERAPIIEDVRHACGMLPPKRRQLRSFKVTEKVEVRATSALIASIMCLLKVPDFRNVPVNVQDGPRQLEDIVTSRKQWYDGTVQIIDSFLSPLVEKASVSKDPEFRAAFQAFLGDMLSLYGMPEWPAVELILQTLAWRTLTSIHQDSNQTAFSLIVALDTLGTISAKVIERHGREIVRPRSDLNQTSEDEDAEEERKIVLLYLRSQSTRRATDAFKFYDSLFIADDKSTIDKRLLNHSKKGSEAGEENENDGDNENREVQKENIHVGNLAITRRRQLATMAKKQMEISYGDAHDAALSISKRRTFVGGLDRILASIVRCMQFSAPTVRAKAIRALGVIEGVSEGVLLLLPEILRFVEAGCMDVSTLVREASVDLLSKSVLSISCFEKDESHDSEQTDDETPKRPDILPSHTAFSIVMKRLSDSATSVRKKCVYIMKSVMEETHQETEKLRNSPGSLLSSTKRIKRYEKRISDICLTLIDRLEDIETSVKEAAERALRFALLGFEIPDSGSRRSTKSAMVAVLAERIVRVISGVPSPSHSRFLARIVNEKVLRLHRKLITAVVNCAMEKFESLEEKMADLEIPNGTTAEASNSRMIVDEIAEKRVACVSVMLAFGTLDFSLILPHCRTLAPSLKSVTDPRSTDNDRQCIQRILKILEIGLGKTQNLDLQFAESVVFDSEAIICQSPSTIVEEAAVRCLCAVVKNAKTEKAQRSMQHATTNFKKFLALQADSLKQYCSQVMPNRPSSLERNTRGALVRLGLLFRYGEFDEAFCNDAFSVLKNLCSFLSVTGTRDNLARAAISALFHFVTRHRHFLVEATALFVNALDFWETSIPVSTEQPTTSENPSQVTDESDHLRGEGVRQVILAGFFELLKDEEDRNMVVDDKQDDGQEDIKNDSDNENEDADYDSNARNGSRKPRSDIVLEAEEDAEAGFLALSAQIFLPRLNRSVRSKSVPVRRNAASIYGLLVRQGLCPPATIVESLFSLLLDNDVRCRELSHRVVSFLADRHSGILASVVKKAIRSCFESSFASRSKVALGVGSLNISELVDEYNDVNEAEQRSLQLLSEIAIDAKTGKCWLSGALMALRGKRRKDVLVSLMDDFDPCIVVERSKNIEQVGSINLNAEAVASTTNLPQGGRNDDDDDIGINHTDRLHLRSSRIIHRLPSLYFLAMTLACLDYTNGSGIGGCLTQGGGTTNAEKDLKFARECVTEIVGAATRIISNSGQAILKLAKQMEAGRESLANDRTEITLLVTRMSLLIQLKHHLKIERWKPLLSNVDLKEDGSPADVQCKLPTFQPICKILVQSFGKDDMEIMLTSTQITDQCKLFYKLMQEDAIAESDLLVPSLRKRRSLGKIRRQSSERKSSMKRNKRKNVVNENRSIKRPRLQRRSSISKSLKFDDGSDNDGSDYDPNC